MRALAALFDILTGGARSTAAHSPGWEREMAAFEAMDRESPPATGQIVFVGSSTIVDWDVAKYFPGVTIIKRGLWGSSLADSVRLLERIVLPYEPRLVVVYAGDNDVDGGQTPEDVTAQSERLVRGVHARLPQTRIVFIGIKPSPARWPTVDRARETNTRIRALAGTDDRIAYLDVDGPMLGRSETPREELFLDDGLHLSAQGYHLWSMLLQPLLAEPERTAD